MDHRLTSSISTACSSTASNNGGAPPRPPPPPPQSQPCQVRCAGCRLILAVPPGVSEFVCPTCRLPQMLPPELLKNFRRPPVLPPPQLPNPNPNPNPNPSSNSGSGQGGPPQAHGIDPAKMQVPCANCKAILNVPHGLTRFKCPQCGVDLAMPSEEVNEVAIEVEQEEDEGGPVGETFTDYRPPKISFGAPHPDPIVETSSLSAVQPPEPTYDLLIRDEIEDSNALSCLQLETLVYASQRHLQHLPDESRAGFFIGDGAGVGKGRTIAGLIWENWQHGRRKALWISVGSDLKFDARRDLDDVGATCVEGRVFMLASYQIVNYMYPLNKLPYSKLDSKAVGIREGVVFLTYNSLIASSEKGFTRLKQLVNWCGTQFDGLVIFDECHKAKNLVPEAGSQPTRTGEAVLELQGVFTVRYPNSALGAAVPVSTRSDMDPDKGYGSHLARLVGHHHPTTVGIGERDKAVVAGNVAWVRGRVVVVDEEGRVLGGGRRVLVVVRRSGAAAVRVLVSGIRVPSMVGDSGGRRGRRVGGVVGGGGRRSNKLPEARVVYCSATGASEPRNMGYMVRLGLWGPGTSFSDFKEFLGALDKGGVGALELVAMDMKARGMFLCRTLSYKGAEFDVVEAPLDAKMTEMYKKAAEFWAELRVELMAAEEKPSSSQLWRLYWASHQRFFRHLCMSAKVPTVVALSKQALRENKCVVIGLQSTGEARTEEAVTKYGLELDDFVSGPRELLLKFVEENYPLPEKPESLADEEGVKELPQKRRPANSDVSFRGRVRKVAKWKAESDEEDYGDSESDIDNESDDEFQICDICNGEEDRKKLLRCASCGKLVHPSCLDPPLAGVCEDWTCNSCKQKTEECLQERRVRLEELTKRYEAAVERKMRILETIRSLDLPNNPLDDIIDQVSSPFVKLLLPPPMG
ncbi:hypothetical protein Cgig2_009508 [Carnegiea gigantea]|uniref:PHD-type domain-containing protein n=1 Tax=Carnegiea gigantea TaxID=171969 RepID=A0A9Q1GVN5_9CARY|nr:hypothetical protein Cgig2_009508 [Carnegiea gigantea]